jgi:hypothetical protein
VLETGQVRKREKAGPGSVALAKGYGRWQALAGANDGVAGCNRRFRSVPFRTSSRKQRACNCRAWLWCREPGE